MKYVLQDPPIMYENKCTYFWVPRFVKFKCFVQCNFIGNVVLVKGDNNLIVAIHCKLGKQ